MVQRTCELGVDIKLQTEVKGIVRSPDGGITVSAFLITEDGNRKEELVIATDMVVHGAGRVPDIEGLDLEAAEIEYDHKKA